MIYVDPLVRHPSGTWCHMVSDTSHEELVEFACSIGLKPEWIQRQGERYEHFDLRPTKRELALKFGALAVSHTELIAAVRRRAEAQKGAPS